MLTAVMRHLEAKAIDEAPGPVPGSDDHSTDQHGEAGHGQGTPLDTAAAGEGVARAAKVLFGELKLVETYGCIKMARSPASGRHATRAAACGDHAAARAIAGAVTGRMSRSPAEASPPRRRSALWLPAGGRDRLAPAASVVRQPG